ncbi:hypothetical protein V9T40_003660 [Parthenolecanium corni]|uniref:Uncharacterized protein n=1 Tax=Parthenolecanium corni TaxID=536013 RepID=A0AAN9TVH7_9HEMI
MDSPLILKGSVLVKQSLKRILNFDFNFGLKRKRSSFKPEELKNFCKLLDDERVKCFLLNDPDCMLADNYLIAMTCIYFVRAQLPPALYDAQHFFSALYLAHQFEEDWDQFREEIVPWFPPTEHQSCALNLNQIKNSIWKLMDYDCRVSKDLCDEKVPKIFNQKLSNRIVTGIRRKRQEFEDYVDSKKRIDESIDKSLEALDDFNFHLSNLTESVERNLSNSTKSVIDEVPKLQIHPSQSNDSAPGIPQKRQEIEDEFDSKKRIDASLDESLENRNLDEDNEEFPENSDDQYAIDELPDPVTLKKGLESVMEDVIEPQFKDVDPELFSKRKEGLENHVLAIESIYSLIGLILSAIVIILPIYTFFLVVLMYRYTTTVITE